MPLTIPILDDRTFDQLAAEANALIPKYCPAWTDHNYSDPGITLLELFAFLMDNAIYQIDQVSERSLEHFAGLIGVFREPGETIEALFRRVRAELDAGLRVITADEFAEQIIGQFPEVARAKASWTNESPSESANGTPPSSDTPWMRVIVVPQPAATDKGEPIPSADLRQRVFEFLRARTLLTTRLQVVEPNYTSIHLAATVVRPGSSRLDRTTIGQQILDAVQGFLDPVSGGRDGHGWPFGRSVFRSELCRVIEDLRVIDHVAELQLGDACSPEGDPPETRAELPLGSPDSLIAWEDTTFTVIVQDS